MDVSVNIMDKVTGYIQYKHISEMMRDMESLNYAVVKGCPLSYYAYSDFGKRSFSDTDLLVDRKDLELFERILLKHGFGQRFAGKEPGKAERESRIYCLANSHQILPYYCMINGQLICVDLNFDLFWGEYTGKRVPIAEFISDAVKLNVYGVEIKTIPPLKMNSIYLLATKNSIKYNMFKDVYYLLKRNPESIALDQLLKFGMEYEMVPYLYYVLYYTGQVFEDKMLEQYIDAFKTAEGEALLNCYGLNEHERKEWKCDFKTRLKADNLYEWIKNDLTEKDKEKIAVNKRIFHGEAAG